MNASNNSGAVGRGAPPNDAETQLYLDTKRSQATATRFVRLFAGLAQFKLTGEIDHNQTWLAFADYLMVIMPQESF